MIQFATRQGALAAVEAIGAEIRLEGPLQTLQWDYAYMPDSSRPFAVLLYKGVANWVWEGMR